MIHESGHYKDEILDAIADEANVAQFVSFGPGPVLSQRFARVRAYPPNHSFAGLDDAAQSLLAASQDRSVNVRSFHPLNPQANEFVYGIGTAESVVATVRRLSAEGLHTIINETIDVNDGGVSGVILDDVIEFAPEDTPRAVEKPGIASFPIDTGRRILDIVYGHSPVAPNQGTRVEFSLHPSRVGYRAEHVITWEKELVGGRVTAPAISWPNRFSRFIGDKVFGLLVAWSSGLPVPNTLVISRRVAPFRFGAAVGTSEVWVRTSPHEPVPGRFTTTRGFVDPFHLLQAEDPEGTDIASVLVQEAIPSEHSGAGATLETGDVLIEGVQGDGAAFMQGNVPPSALPDRIQRQLHELHVRLVGELGPVRFEWAHDGSRAWILQLHSGATPSGGTTIYPGDVDVEHRFEVADGLEALRRLVGQVKGTGDGIVLVGRVGVTSHFGDVLRRAEVPSRVDSSNIPVATEHVN